MKTTVKEVKPCPNCGSPLPAGALGGLCPKCLLAHGADTEPGGPPGSGRFQPPPVAEVAKLFPQLEILGLLGAGGMGAVYQARQPALDRIVALKILPTTGASGANFEERFNREARALARLSHPNIVAVFEFGQVGGEGGLHFFIMEFVDGANLRQLEQAGRLAPREALQLIPQICDALQYAHDEGVVHRDIKPENVLVDRKGRVKIADFGLAKILGHDPDAARLTAEGQVMGTPHYMAPEQIEKPLLVDHRADIYSLGVVLYEMLTGDLPLGKFSPPSRKVQVDVRFDEVVLRALENDPARRYQHASEVKSQVENIAGTPAPAASAAPTSDQNFIRWAGFPVVTESDGGRRVNRKEALKMFGIFFGVLTVAFGLVSLVTGRTLFGWLGIAGSTSLLLRLLVAALFTAFGLWRAFRWKPVMQTLPQTPQGTVILAPERFSRKAIIGACWMPFFFLAGLLWMPSLVVVTGDVAQRPEPSMRWWQILLLVAVALPGLVAPFGTTILGWFAVSDIRRTRGRISGLPLAVFDGLVFPLLALNLFLGNGLLNAFYWYTATQMPRTFQNPPRELVMFGVVAICGLVDFLIVRRVWRAVRLENPPAPRPRRDGWWSRKPAAIAIGVACAAIIALHVLRQERPPGVFKNAPQQVATLDTATGTLVAKLPKGGTVELLAVSDAGSAPNAWWTPDGTAVPDRLYELVRISSVESEGRTNKDFVLHLRDLPEGTSGPQVEFNLNGGSTSGGEVWRDGKKSFGAWPVRAAFPLDATEATVRAGFGLEAWQVISIHDRNGNGQAGPASSRLPRINAQVHEVGEENGEARLTLLLTPPGDDWELRVIAVDTTGKERTQTRSSATPTGKTAVQSYEFFQLPRAQVKEFQVQARPVHWVEFRKVKLVPNDRRAVGKSSRVFKPTGYGEAMEIQLGESNALFDFDKGRSVAPTAAVRSMSTGQFLKSALARELGVDAVAGSNELRLVEMSIADLTAGDWETLTPEKLVERLNRGLYGPPRLPVAPVSGLPKTYAFRTRDYGTGMMQLTSLPEGVAGVRVRYKVIERAHFE